MAQGHSSQFPAYFQTQYPFGCNSVCEFVCAAQIRPTSHYSDVKLVDVIICAFCC